MACESILSRQALVEVEELDARAIRAAIHIEGEDALGDISPFAE